MKMSDEILTNNQFTDEIVILTPSNSSETPRLLRTSSSEKIKDYISYKFINTASSSKNSKEVHIHRQEDNQNHLTFTKNIEPIIIQTDPKKYKLHGLVDHFDETLPHELVGKVSPDEFKITINKINNLLKRRLKNQQRRLIASTIFCGLTIGASFYFAYDYNEKTLEKLKRLIAEENSRIYVNTLNMRWTLIMRPVNKFLEYNLIIEFIPKYNFTLPD